MMHGPELDIESPVCDVIFYEGVFFWMIFGQLPVAICYRLVIKLIIELVGTLPVNAQQVHR